MDTTCIDVELKRMLGITFYIQLIFSFKTTTVVLIIGHRWAGGDWLWQALGLCHGVWDPLSGKARRGEGGQRREEGELVRKVFF